jgi:hypothetical protein
MIVYGRRMAKVMGFMELIRNGQVAKNLRGQFMGFARVRWVRSRRDFVANAALNA